MPVPFSYSMRNLAARRLTAALTVSGMALVVFVFATVLMLEEGLHGTLVATGSFDNVLVARRGAGAEVQSAVDRAQAGIVETLPQVMLGSDSQRLVSKEVVVLISLLKRSSDKPSNVLIRGIGAQGMALRPQVRLVGGRMFRPGSSEIIAGRSIGERFAGAGLGEQLRFAAREWTVVGHFEAARSAFDSEIWGDADQMLQAFRRTAYSSVLFRLTDAAAFEGVKSALETDPRLTLEAKRESDFYEEQSRALANFIRILGLSLSVIFSTGAVIGAMITMYAAVSNRTAEIGTLRALGFGSTSILWAFLLEALLIGAAVGALGLALASLMQLVSFSTMNFQTFAELAFSFTLTPKIVVLSMLFALAMGAIGGFLPAVRAARLKIVDALRAA
jgi:ABC-type antimicrobial peptide transport system permease subunit